MLNPREYSLDTTPPQDYEPEPRLWSALSLTEIADAYLTDKGTIKHNYTQHYEKYLSHLRIDPYQHPTYEPMALLEIGVACAASLKMWSRYFPHAKITGVDINPACAELCRDYDNIRIVIKDATKEVIPGNYSVIIDDGSHTATDIFSSFRLHWQYVKSGGYYIIEDTACTLPERNYRRPTRLDGENERKQYVELIDGLLRALDRGKRDVEFVHCYRECVIVKKSN